MDIKQLRCFAAVAEELHFGRAAERLHMASPALSRQIRLLEDELDVRLFSRTTRTVALTRAGSVFVDEAREILTRTKNARTVVQEAARNGGEVLRIGALDTAAAGFLPDVLFAFRNAFPHVRIHLEEATTSRQLQGLVTGRLDLGFLRPPVHEPDLQWEFLLRERLVVAVPVAHRLAEARSIALHDILDEPLILPPKRARPCTYALVVRRFEEVGAHPNVVQEATEKQTIVSMVAAGMGIALVPEWVSKLRIAGVVYRAFEEPEAEEAAPESLLGICVRKHQKLDVRDAFLSFVRPGVPALAARGNVAAFPRPRRATA